MPNSIWLDNDPPPLERYVYAVLRSFFSEGPLTKLLEHEKKALAEAQQRSAELSEGENLLAGNFLKIEVMDKCIAENKKTRAHLYTVLDLLTVGKKAYEAMARFRSRNVKLKSGTYDVFSDIFLRTKIEPYLQKLLSIEPVSFNEFPPIQDACVESMISNTISQRAKVMQMASSTQQWCAIFLADRAKLNRFFSILEHLQLRLFGLAHKMHGAQSTSDSAYTLDNQLLARNNQYEKRVLPEFKQQLQEEGISAALNERQEHLANSNQDVQAHKRTIQYLGWLLERYAPKEKVLPIANQNQFFAAPKFKLIIKEPSAQSNPGDEKASLPINGAPIPKSWNRTTLS